MKLAFIGGDMRCESAAEYLEKSGYEICFVNTFDDVYMLKNADAVILGVISVDEYGRIAGGGCNISYADLAKLIPDNVPIIGGRLPCYAGHKCADVLQRDDFAMLNAALTAEGAIMLAIQNTKFGIFGSEVLVCGFGRIGKMLAHRLSVFACRVTCSLRKASDAAFCGALGYNFVFTDEIVNTADRYGIIFNTIPHTVIDERIISKLDKKTVIIELASKPGGVCIDCAEKYGITVIDGGSIPGRFSPLTAGKIYGLTIENILKEGV